MTILPESGLPVNGSYLGPGSLSPSPESASLDTKGNKSSKALKTGVKGEEKAARRRARRGSESAQVVTSLRVLGRDREADEVARCGRLVRVSDQVELGGCGAELGRQYFTCKYRLCPWCSQARAQRLGMRVAAAVTRLFTSPVLMVLTVVNGEDLAERDAHLRRSVAKLERHPRFRECFPGGFCFWETTHGASGWHPHVNILADGYMDQAELAELWHRITGDSFIVWVKRIAGDVMAGVVEAVKYVCKLSEVVGSPALVGAFLAATASRRMFWGFGSCRAASSLVVDQVAEDEVQSERAASLAKDTCPVCGHVGSVRGVTGDGRGLVWVPRAWGKPLGRGWYLLVRRE